MPLIIKTVKAVPKRDRDILKFPEPEGPVSRKAVRREVRGYFDPGRTHDGEAQWMQRLCSLDRSRGIHDPAGTG